MKRRALTDEQNAIAVQVMAAIAGTDPADAFAAFASIMAATINGQSATTEEALARGQMWGQLFLDMLVDGREGAFAVGGGLVTIDKVYVQ